MGYGIGDFFAGAVETLIRTREAGIGDLHYF